MPFALLTCQRTIRTTCAHVLQLLELCDVNNSSTTEVAVALQAIYALHGVFVANKAHSAGSKKKSSVGVDGAAATATDSSRDAKSKYRELLHEQYLDFVSVLVGVLRSGEPAVLCVPCLKVSQSIPRPAGG